MGTSLEAVRPFHPPTDGNSSRELRFSDSQSFVLAFLFFKQTIYGLASN